MDGVLGLGDVFRFDEKEYVYLLETAAVVYAVRILDPSLSRTLVTRAETEAKKPGVGDRPMYAFVVLTTAQLKNRAAFYAPPYDGIGWNIEEICTLNDEDKNKLVEEILASPHVPTELRESLRGFMLDEQLRGQPE